MLIWDGYSGTKHWSDQSAPTGKDWTTLARELLVTQATVDELEKKVKALEILIAALSVKDAPLKQNAKVGA